MLDYTGALTFEEFVADGLRYDATLRNLESMSDAAKCVTYDLRERFSNVPSRDLAGFRDRLAHAHDALDDRIVWDAVQRSVPATLMAVRAALNVLG